MSYAHLHTTTNFTFLTGASHPHELVARAWELGYDALAITDECSLAGIVKAYTAIKQLPEEHREAFTLLIGSRFRLSNGLHLIAIAPDRKAYAELSGFISLARRRAEKGSYEAHMKDLRFRLQTCLIIWLADRDFIGAYGKAHALKRAFKERLWIGMDHQLLGGEQQNFIQWHKLGQALDLPLVACGEALMHERARKPLQDVLTGIRENAPISELGTRLRSNAEAYLKPLPTLQKLYPRALLKQSQIIASRCEKFMHQLRYQYPQELVPTGQTPIQYLRQLVEQGKHQRYPDGVPESVEQLLEKELTLIEEERYEFFFLTVYDIVQFARSQDILCQGRGSAANSVVCYCLFITAIRPGQINVLFERFISKERKEPPDIDVDFEHQRREEVIQYIYRKYGRERAAIAATVITYRTRSAIRDVGKALGLDATLIDHLAKSHAWWDGGDDLQNRIAAAGLNSQSKLLTLFFQLVSEIKGFPRHLSQHVGGFVIAQDKVSDLVPLENASMPNRTIIQWDKEDLESMRLLKVDVLSLGMLTALKKMLQSVNSYDQKINSIEDIPADDEETYEMLCRADSVGVFQVESRAQMSMLPRLRPREFYDLVIQVAIVRPGPVQGNMVHPYLRRRHGLEKEYYYSDDIRSVLQSTKGIPIFQEQAIRLSMVAAGFSAGRADALRRAMATWGKNGNLLQFRDEFINGMLARHYPAEFAHNLFEQLKGFGGYGFPESHSASFALLCYASSWLKCHHPAAFYCALLNSQPMGFYSPSQLVQDAQRHNIAVLPIDINASHYEHSLVRIKDTGNAKMDWNIRLGFSRIRSLEEKKARAIEQWRQNKPFESLQDLARRTELTQVDLQHLASADALRSLSGNRHQARWQAAAIKPYLALLEEAEVERDELFTPEPTTAKDMLDDYATTGLSLRPHPMALLRSQYPFNRCKKYSDLEHMRHGGFVRVAGLVTGRQRPGTANNTIFVTLEDETGNINVVVWQATQEQFRQELLSSQLLMVKGKLEIGVDKDKNTNQLYKVVHVVAGHLTDCTHKLAAEFKLKSRDFH
jgi:error-prone DNA polymerase